MVNRLVEGQEIEVLVNPTVSPFKEESDRAWRKAKIVCRAQSYYVEFPDGTRAVFEAGSIRVNGVRQW